MTYCSTLTDAQLENVLLIEYDRKERGGDRDLYQEAREECLRRGMEPDEILETCGADYLMEKTRRLTANDPYREIGNN